jgi:bifunctional DNA-binding transcriptional regulator/antitoxin component of YhaV-PrlF toxin-antitoxin module
MATQDQDHGELLTDNVPVRSHGRYENDSVGVVIPVSSRQLLGIDAGTELVVRCWRNCIRLSPRPDEMPGGQLIAASRSPVKTKRSMRVNIPASCRDVLGIEHGDQLRCRTFTGYVELQPLEDALDLQEL